MVVLANVLVLAVVVVGFLLLRFFGRRDSIPQSGEDLHVLRATAFWRWYPYFAFGGACALVLLDRVVATLSPKETLEPHVLLNGVALFFAVFGLYGGRQARGGYFAVGKPGVIQHSPWWGTKRLDWKDIQEVEKNRDKGRIRLIGRGGTTLTFDGTYWTGIELLAQAMDAEVPADKIKEYQTRNY